MVRRRTSVASASSTAVRDDACPSRGVRCSSLDASDPSSEVVTRTIAPPADHCLLESIAVNGVLPRWSGWWPADRRRSLSRCRRCAQAVSPPRSRPAGRVLRGDRSGSPGWANRQCGYLVFSDGSAAAVNVRARGFRCAGLRRTPASMLHDPDRVAAAIVSRGEPRTLDAARRPVLRLRSLAGRSRPRRTGSRLPGAVAGPVLVSRDRTASGRLPRAVDETVISQDNQHVVAYWAREPSILRFCA